MTLTQLFALLAALREAYGTEFVQDVIAMLFKRGKVTAEQRAILDAHHEDFQQWIKERLPPEPPSSQRG